MTTRKREKLFHYSLNCTFTHEFQLSRAREPQKEEATWRTSSFSTWQSTNQQSSLFCTKPNWFLFVQLAHIYVAWRITVDCSWGQFWIIWIHGHDYTRHTDAGTLTAPSPTCPTILPVSTRMSEKQWYALHSGFSFSASSFLPRSTSSFRHSSDINSRQDLCKQWIFAIGRTLRSMTYENFLRILMSEENYINRKIYRNY